MKHICTKMLKFCPKSLDYKAKKKLPIVKEIKKVQHKALQTHTIQPSVQIPISKRQRELWAVNANETSVMQYT